MSTLLTQESSKYTQFVKHAMIKTPLPGEKHGSNTPEPSFRLKGGSYWKFVSYAHANSSFKETIQKIEVIHFGAPDIDLKSYFLFCFQLCTILAYGTP